MKALALVVSSLLIAAGGPALAADDSAKKPAAAAAQPSKAKAGAEAAKAPATRDWSQVDTNKDGLVSPEEMSAYLQANPGPLKAK